jgi:hypothetical protein
LCFHANDFEDEDDEENDAHDTTTKKTTKPEVVLYNKRGCRYWLADSGTSKRSPVWGHGQEVYAFEPGEPHLEGKKWWMCMKCLAEGRKPAIKLASTTSKAFDHLETAHRIFLQRGKTTKARENCTEKEEVPKTNLDRTNILTSAAILFAVTHTSFSFWETEAFRHFIHTLNPQAAMMLPKTADSAKKMVEGLYKKQQSEVREILAQTPSKISLSFDGWTAPNKCGIVAVVASWTNGEEVKTALLGMAEIDGKHTGCNIAKCIEKIESDYGLNREDMVAHVGDHAANNGTTIEALGDHDRDTQVFCIGHSFNLAVRTFLKYLDKISRANDANNDDDDDDGDDDDGNDEIIGDNDKDDDGHAIMGPVSKLQHLASHLSRSTYLTQSWDKQFKKRIVEPNSTRWNSTWMMVESVKSQIAVPRDINNFLEAVDVDLKLATKLKALTFSDNEWPLLQEIQDVLSPFEIWTKRLEGAIYFFS